MFSRIRSLFDAVWNRSRFEKEMEVEMKTHRESYVDDLVSRGVSDAEAEQRAAVEFGSTQALKEECRGFARSLLARRHRTRSALRLPATAKESRLRSHYYPHAGAVYRCKYRHLQHC